MEYHYQFRLIEAIRKFFGEAGFTDVLTPPMVQNPGMETHVHPFQVSHLRQKKNSSWYLHTSPEFMMKRLLSEGLEKIFTISYCMRDEPLSPIHRPQFLMLEWYRSRERYEKIMSDVQELMGFCREYLALHKIPLKHPSTSVKWEKISVSDLFEDQLKIKILDFLEVKELSELIKKKFPDVPLPKGELEWDDCFFLLFLNKIEPMLKRYPFLILHEYPAPLAALSTLKEKDPRVCERFEVYVDGIELANCYNELTDLTEQKKRFTLQNQEKNRLYGYHLPEPKTLYHALKKDFPKSSGIALGVERLLLALTPVQNPFFDELF